MFAGHAGRRRKGIRARPYFHHVLMVVFLAWLADLPKDLQKAAVCHDDLEDVPKNLGVTADWVRATLQPLIGEAALSSVQNLTNLDHAHGKHAGQIAKMAKITVFDGTLKLLDRIANLFDMRQDKPKGFGPDRIRTECDNAFDLAQAMPQPAAEPILALLAFGVAMLAKENNIEPAWATVGGRELTIDASS